MRPQANKRLGAIYVSGAVAISLQVAASTAFERATIDVPKAKAFTRREEGFVIVTKEKKPKKNWPVIKRLGASKNAFKKR
jgi:hypothetical protein